MASDEPRPRRHCRICGETRFPGWPYCPGCGHPYPRDDEDED